MKELIKAINNIKVDLQNSKITKSGKNTFSNFTYYELSDFLPTLNELLKKNGVLDQITIKDNVAKLTLFKDDESISFEFPFKEYVVPLNKSGKPQMQEVQYLGAVNTYIKRYLYINAFGITDGEVIDGMDQVEKPNKQPTEKMTPQDFMEKEAENTIPAQISKMLKQEYKTAKLVKEKMLEYGLIDENNKQADLTLEEWKLKHDIITEDLLTKESDGINQIK